jgi:methionyl-tRNA formyltransferase
MKNIVFMGTPDYAVRILRALAIKFDITGVFTQPDKPVGRKQIVMPSDVKIFTQQSLPNTKIFTPKTLKDEALVEQIRSMKPDFIVVAAYGKILPKAVLDIAPCINLHASILPKYRGASPIQSAILNGETQTGVTAMLMNEGLDTGDMLDFAYANCERKTSIDLFDELGDLAAELIIKTLENFKKIAPIKQDDSKATLCKKIVKSDGEISFCDDAKVIYDKFRAFKIWPGIFTINGTKLLDIELCQSDYQNAVNGQIAEISKSDFTVACKNKSLKIKLLQESGKKIVNAKSFINGKRLKLGDFLN